MNKQIIALIGILVTLTGGVSVALVNCFNAQQEILTNLNQAFIDQSKEHGKSIAKLHDEYNAKIIDIIIKGN